MSKSLEEREKLLKDDTFRESITAKVYLVEVTSEQASKYASIMLNSPVFVTTVLQRNKDVADYVETLNKALKNK